MEITILLCLLEIMFCPSLCLALTCPVTMENDEHAYNNPKSLFLAAPYYDVFLNHRDADVRKAVASLIFHNLENKGLKVFVDKKSIQVGNSIPQSMEDAIYSTSLHIVIMSANYAESTSCLKELNLILKTGAPIIPVFCGVEPSELRMKDKNSVYAPAVQKHKHSGKFEVDTVDEWRKALHEVSYIKGYIFRGYNYLLLCLLQLTKFMLSLRCNE
ncbi:hypothetical protein SUGI_0081650 [Cryptomeria japonica]|nr:hypothetical protein SUGI_0081650 [Cryptomeria japonica]